LRTGRISARQIEQQECNCVGMHTKAESDWMAHASACLSPQLRLVLRELR
jgi:hypothetical protein